MPLQDGGINVSRDRRELKLHGTAEFPCAGYRSTITNRAGHRIPWHRHEEIEVLYLASGSLELCLLGRTNHLRSGDGAFINSNVLHMACSGGRCELCSLVFRPSLISGAADSVFDKKYVRPLVESATAKGILLRRENEGDVDALIQLEEAFRAMSGAEPGHEFAVRGHLSHLWYLLYARKEADLDDSPVHASTVDAVRLKAMLDYIHAHYPQPLTLAEIAQAANIGERECLRCFRRTIDLSPKQYLQQYRIAEAAVFLRESTLTVAEVALHCGFDSPSNFAQTFRKYYHCSPRDFRRDFQEGRPGHGVLTSGFSGPAAPV